MHINRPVAMQMGQMGPNGSSNASNTSCPSLLFFDLAVCQPRQLVYAQPGFVVGRWYSVMMLAKDPWTKAERGTDN